MKKIASLLSAASLMLVSSAVAAKDFEGEIVYNIQADGESIEMTYFVKDDKVAFVVPQAQGGHGFLDFETNKAYIIMPDHGMYMEMDSDEFGQNMKQLPEGEFTVTDETGERLGYSVRKVVFEGEEGRTEMWVTQELGFMLPMKKAMEDEFPSELLASFPDGYFPLDITNTTPQGEVVRMEVLSVEKTDVSDDRFVVPEGLQRISM